MYIQIIESLGAPRNKKTFHAIGVHKNSEIVSAYNKITQSYNNNNNNNKSFIGMLLTSLMSGHQ